MMVQVLGAGIRARGVLIMSYNMLTAFRCSYIPGIARLVLPTLSAAMHSRQGPPNLPK